MGIILRAYGLIPGVAFLFLDLMKFPIFKNHFHFKKQTYSVTTTKLQILFIKNLC